MKGAPNPHASCRELLERLSGYLDGERDLDLCRRIEQHMRGCAPCQRLLDSLRRTVDWVRSLPSPRLPADLAREILEACERARREVDPQAPPSRARDLRAAPRI